MCHIGDNQYAQGYAGSMSHLEVSRSIGDFKWKMRSKGILNRAAVKDLTPTAEDQQRISDALYSLLVATPSVVEIATEDEEFLVMGSDGFWDSFEPTELFERPFDTEALAEAALARASRPDDITVVVVDLVQRREELSSHHQARHSVVTNLSSRFEEMKV